MLKPCLNHGIHMLFEHGFLLENPQDCLRDVK